MTRRVGTRRLLWGELAAALGSAALAVVTLLWPDWIERVFGVSPDQGSGALEWLIVVVALAVSVAFAIAARLEWRRTRVVKVPG